MDVQPKKRQKRDTVENIYKHCAGSGTCPEDVKNKVEQTTLADKLLKWIASVVYFGGLGIGTGKGTGGASGYVPIGSGSAGGGRVTSQGTVVRPGVVVDPIGPPDIVPIDAVTPQSSSVVPLEVIPEIVGDPTPPDISTPNIITVTDPVSDITLDTTSPAVATIDPTSAILEVQPTASTPKRVSVGSSRHVTPSYISVYGHPTDPVTQSAAEVFIGGAVTEGSVVNIGESIPLETFVETQGSATFDIEPTAEPPRTSTPRAFQRAFQRARELYNRRVQQVRTRNIDFLNRPRQAVTFQFENPAFEDEVSLVFEQDLNALATAAPDPDFADVVRLGRPTLSETPEGHIRLSRLGQRGTIRTRSGLQIGPHVHYYYDLSSIHPDSFELQPLGQHSGDTGIIDAATAQSIVADTAESSFIEGQTLIGPQLDNELLDSTTEDFSSSRLRFAGVHHGIQFPSLDIVTLPPGAALQFVVTASTGKHNTTTIIPQYIPTTPFIPSVVVDSFVTSTTFYLHPGLSRKRKRSHMF